MDIQSTPEVKVIEDSVCLGRRITTFQLRYWRPIHPEIMTHRVFSRNAGSSRARPSRAIIDQVRNSPWGPVEWGSNRPGMQPDREIEGTEEAAIAWSRAAMYAAQEAERLLQLGIHKQVVNRILEPFSYIDVVLTSTDWDNFFKLRMHEDAQIEIRELAAKMYAGMSRSASRKLGPNEWHLPYVTNEERYRFPVQLLRRISAARCARVSYRPFNSDSADIDRDLALFKKLVGSDPGHLSPLEHQAKILRRCRSRKNCGNLTGWVQYRKLMERGHDC